MGIFFFFCLLRSSFLEALQFHSAFYLGFIWRTENVPILQRLWARKYFSFFGNGDGAKHFLDVVRNMHLPMAAIRMASTMTFLMCQKAQRRWVFFRGFVFGRSPSSVAFSCDLFANLNGNGEKMYATQSTDKKQFNKGKNWSLSIPNFIHLSFFFEIFRYKCNQEKMTSVCSLRASARNCMY